MTTWHGVPVRSRRVTTTDEVLVDEIVIGTLITRAHTPGAVLVSWVHPATGTSGVKTKRRDATLVLLKVHERWIEEWATPPVQDREEGT